MESNFAIWQPWIQEQQQEASLAAKYAQVSKQKKSSSGAGGGDQRYYDKYSYDQGYHSGGHRSKQYRDRSPGVQQQQQQQHQYSQERLQAARQAQEVVQCAKGDLSEQQDHKFLESTSAESKERAAVKAAREQQQQQATKTVTVQEPQPSPPLAEQAEQTPPPPPPITEQPKAKSSSSSAAVPSAAAEDPKPKPPQEHKPGMTTFTGAASSNKAEVQLQQEQIQYVDNECCQVAVKSSTAAKEQTMNEAQQLDNLQQQPPMATATLKRSKGKAAAAASQFNTLERNMAEVAEQEMQSQRALQSAANTLDRRDGTMRGGGGGGGGGHACDTCDAPLTPASIAGFDHRDLEQRPLTRSVTRATIFDEPPEK